MAVFKCKMCGADLNIVEGVTVVECEYCGTTQTVSCNRDEKRINLYNRANRHRINGEFDRASSIYESIVVEFPEEAEAYWGMVICNYGIEYVDDPATARKIPTCHRASFESIENDENYKLALKYADADAQAVYRSEAQEIDRIREDILSVCKNEKPYDIFICFKHLDDNGKPTIDSVLAENLYDALSEKGYKVFFSKITLQDKGGILFEPYIFAALNSAKVMLAVGTSYDHYDSVWVKNEWSRFLKLMAKDKSKIMLPCFKDMPANELPKEFNALQAQDLGRVGVVQDIVKGIEKIIQKSPPVETAKLNKTVSGEVTVETLLERAYILLHDGDFDRANAYFEKVLDRSPKESRAYWGKLLCKEKCLDNAELTSERRIQMQYISLTQNKDITILSDNELIGLFRNALGTNYVNALEYAVGDAKSIYLDCFEKSKNILLKLLHNAKETRRIQRERQIAEEQQRKEAEKKQKAQKMKKALVGSIITSIILLVFTISIFTSKEFLDAAIRGNLEEVTTWIWVHVQMLLVLLIVFVVSKICNIAWPTVVGGIVYFGFCFFVMIKTWSSGFGFGAFIGAAFMMFVEIAITSGYFMLMSKAFDNK